MKSSRSQLNWQQQEQWAKYAETFEPGKMPLCELCWKDKGHTLEQHLESLRVRGEMEQP